MILGYPNFEKPAHLRFGYTTPGSSDPHSTPLEGYGDTQNHFQLLNSQPAAKYVSKFVRSFFEGLPMFSITFWEGQFAATHSAIGARVYAT